MPCTELTIQINNDPSAYDKYSPGNRVYVRMTMSYGATFLGLEYQLSAIPWQYIRDVVDGRLYRIGDPDEVVNGRRNPVPIAEGFAIGRWEIFHTISVDPETTLVKLSKVSDYFDYDENGDRIRLSGIDED